MPFEAREKNMTDSAACAVLSLPSDQTQPSGVDAAACVQATPLGEARRGFCGRIEAILVDENVHGRQAPEIESRLIELGFVEGAEVNILHEGPIGRDPIAVRINGTTIALRRREAMAILVTTS